MEHSGQPRDLFAQEPVGVARAVVPLVVVTDDRQLGGKAGDLGDDLGAQDRVRVHHLALIAGQPVLLEQDVVGHADLAHVVEQAAPLQSLHVPRIQAQHPADVGRDVADIAAVERRGRITLVHGPGQCLDGLSEHLAHLNEALIGQPDHVHGQSVERSCPPPDSLIGLGHQPSERREGNKAGEDPAIAASNDRGERRL